MPSPIAAEQLAAVPGVLGRIARERAGDYEGVGDGQRGRSAVTDADPSAPAASRWVRALAGPQLALIAEVKGASPSQGPIRSFDPVEVASAFVAGGASAVSVLTEPRHFGGSLEHLSAVSAAVPSPTLRKDFVVHPAQVFEARRHGAAAVLLIVAVLGEALGSYLSLARRTGLEALVEVHDDTELDLALAAGAAVIGVNNRDLRTLAIDRRTAPRLIERGRSSDGRVLWVAESGYEHASDLDEVRGLADAVLVGTSLSRHPDPRQAVRELLVNDVHDGTHDGPVVDSRA